MRFSRLHWLFGTLSLLALMASPLLAIEKEPVPVNRFLDLIRVEKSVRKAAAQEIGDNWQNAYTPIILELLQLTSHPTASSQMWRLLDKQTGQKFRSNFDKAYDWLWQNDFGVHPNYGLFKAIHYANIDRRFFTYFDSHTENAKIRLDEIRWGGVRRDGIPPLDRPEMISVEEADYLDDDNIVFGIEINGDARAYPKRILAWHEMFKDTVGGVSVNGVYCTLCGTVILYKTEHEGAHYELGTSGFLYRSNKLMYDHETESLWNTLDGEPVVGPLVGKGIKLEPLYVVTTTWGEWKSRHPETTVLSLNTGHNRDYGEGVAYRDYFGTDELMFITPFKDKRLKNKDEVFVLRFGRPFDRPKVYAVKYLSKKKLVQDTYGGTSYVLISDRSGAIRAYESDGKEFTRTRDRIMDTNGSAWQMTETALVDNRGEKLKRLPSHRAFWFGWHAGNPNTELIK